MKKNVIIVSGVSTNGTPVLQNTIEYLNKDYNCKVNIYEHKRIVSFVINAIRDLIFTRNKAKVYFIGIQSLPILFLFQYCKYEKYYWALESYKFRFLNSPFVYKILLIEYLINWLRINLIIPSEKRIEHYTKRKYKNIFIVENTQRIGNKYYKRNICENDRIKFVIYGRLNNKDIYLEETIKYCKKYSEYVELFIIGWDYKQYELIAGSSNIYYLGAKKHDELLKILEKCHYSIIGYRPISYNNKYCAPNKLLEAFSQSLPVICNQLNPPLEEIIDEYKCGKLIDLSRFDEYDLQLLEELKYKYGEYNENTFKAYVNKYNFENYFTKTL